MRMLGKLLLLLAVVLMPLGMGATPAAAASHHTGMAMPAHCPDDTPMPAHHDGGKAGILVCTMACAAALPAFDRPIAANIARPRAPLTSTAVPSMAGVILEIATPPPRFA